MHFPSLPERLEQFYLKTPGAVLRAEDYLPNTLRVQPRQTPAFEMASGSQQRRFVSLWALFQNRDMCRETIEHMVRMALDIRSITRFTTIVTCTVTSKYLMEQIHARLEASENEKINIRYFGPYPYHIVESSNLRDLQNQRVLILTDVISTGKLVSHLASVVEELGGSVAAILSVVATNPDLCEQPRVVNESAPGISHRLFHNESLNSPLPVYAVIDLPAERMTEATKPPFLVKVDPVSIMPASGDITETRAPVQPLITLKDSISLVERTNSVVMGFFGSEFRRFSFAFRLDRILTDEDAGRRIWAELKRVIRRRKRPLLVTNFDAENLRFSDFIRERMKADGSPIEVVYIPQTQENLSISGFFLSDSDRSRLEGRDVFIVLGTANTSERLRNLISITASEAPNSIAALILLDRMDTSSARFVPIVRRLASRRAMPWQSSIFSSEGVRFSCHSVFRFHDFGTHDVARMQDMVNRLLIAFKTWCRTSSFRLLTEHDQKYFLTQRMTGFQFERSRIAPARPATHITIGKVAIETHSGDAQLLILVLKCIYEKEYDPLIEYLRLADDKTLIYAIVALILTDVSFLKASGAFIKLIEKIKTRIRESRYKRQDLEIAFNKKWNNSAGGQQKAYELSDLKAYCDNAVEIESYFMFGLALLGFLDTHNDYQSTILEAIGGEGWARPGASIEDLPINFLATMRETRTFWAASMLAFFTDKNFRDFLAPGELSQEMLRQARVNNTRLTRIQSNCSPDELQHVLAAITNVDGLRSELREYNLRSSEEAIRLMHKQLILQSPRHSPAQLVLTSIRNDLADIVDQTKQKHQNYSLLGMPEQKQLQRRLEAGWDQVSILQRIGEAAGEVFSSSDLMVAARAPKRFIRFEDQHSARGAAISQLESDIEELSAILLRIRQFNAFELSEFYRYNRILERIENDLWRFSDESIIPSLCYFIVPVVTRVKEAMIDAVDGLSRANVGTELIELLKTKAEDLDAKIEEHYCLSEPLLLSETFRNVFTNIRHAMVNGQRPLLEIRLGEVMDESEPMFGATNDTLARKLVKLEIITPGNVDRVLASDEEPTTLARQKAELRNYGVDVTISRSLDPEGISWLFTLRSRDDHVRALRRDLARIEGVMDLTSVRHIFRARDTND